MSEYYLYKYFIDDELVYIGITNDLYGRYLQHKNDWEEYDKINFIEYYGHESYTFIASLENIFIKYFKPKLNKSGKDESNDYSFINIESFNLEFQRIKVIDLKKKSVKRASKTLLKYKKVKRVSKILIIDESLMLNIINKNIFNNDELNLISFLLGQTNNQKEFIIIPVNILKVLKSDFSNVLEKINDIIDIIGIDDKKLIYKLNRPLLKINYFNFHNFCKLDSEGKKNLLIKNLPKIENVTDFVLSNINNELKIKNISNIILSDMNSIEIDLMVFIMAQFNNNQNITMKFNFNDIKKGVNYTKGRSEEVFHNDLSSMIYKTLNIKIKRENTKEYNTLSLFDFYKIDRKNKIIILKINDTLIDMLNDFENNSYKTISLDELKTLKGKYSKRIFIRIKLNEQTNYLLISRKELLELLNVPETMTFSQMKNKILIKSITEIQRIFPKITFEEIKGGKEIRSNKTAKIKIII